MSSFPTEFLQICKAVAVGFAVMGFIGYFVKLIHIPMYVFPLMVMCYGLTIDFSETISLCMSFLLHLGEILPITTTVEAHDYLTLRPHNQFFSLFHSFDLIYNFSRLGETHTRGLYQNCWKFDRLIPAFVTVWEIYPTAVLKTFESFWGFLIH